MHGRGGVAAGFELRQRRRQLRGALTDGFGGGFPDERPCLVARHAGLAPAAMMPSAMARLKNEVVRPPLTDPAVTGRPHDR